MPSFDPSDSRVAAGILPNLGTAVGASISGSVNNVLSDITNGAINTVTTGVTSGITSSIQGQLSQLGEAGKNPVVQAAWNQLSTQLGSIIGSGLNNLIRGSGAGWINANEANVFQSGVYQSLNTPTLLSGGREAGLPERSIRITGELGSFVFPVTPQITVTHAGKYNTASLTHTVATQYFYENSEVSSININADCPCQTQEDAKALMAGIFVLRAYTKMYYGASANSGSPPPLAFLHGYGQYFNKVPCVVTNVQHTLPDTVDYINSGTIWVPTSGQIAVQLQPVYSRNKLEKFNLNSYAVGGLLGEGII